MPEIDSKGRSDHWEYTSVGFFPDGMSIANADGTPHKSAEAIKTFNQLGAEGWELVCTTPAHSIKGMHRAFFKRRLRSLEEPGMKGPLVP